MSHETIRMSSVKNPTKRFDEVIRRIEDSFDVTKGDKAFLSPFLNSEVLDFKMTNTIGWVIIIDDLDCSFLSSKRGSPQE